MRSGLSAVAALSNITAQWIFEVDSNYWTFGNDITYDSDTYTSKIISESFTGIKEKNTRCADKLIPPNTTEFSVSGSKGDFSAPGFKGEDVLITLLNSGVKVYSWLFSVKSCHYEYGKFNFTCEDFLQQYLFQNYYPDTALLNSYNDTTAVMDGPDNAVIPKVFGTAYPQLRMIPDANEWYAVLGAVVGTYTITEIASPVEFANNTSTYGTATYTFTQSTITSLRVFENDIGQNGVNAPFGQSGKLYDLPTKFSNSATSAVTSPADIIETILEDIGVPSAQIDSAGTFASAKTALATLGITYNYCFTTKEDALKVLCELLESCNCIMPRSDVVQLIVLEGGAAVKEINRNNILNLNFAEKIYKESFDGGYATYYPGIQDGVPSEIGVAIDGSSYTNISAEKVLYKYTTNTQIIQKLAIVNFRRKFLQTGTVSFSSNHSMIEPYLGDRLSILDDLYESYPNVYVDQITIMPDLKFEFSLDAYSAAIGDLTDYSPAAVTLVADASPIIAPVINVVPVVDGPGVLVADGATVSIADGADITLDSTATDPGEVIFNRSGTKVASIFADAGGTGSPVLPTVSIIPASTGKAFRIGSTTTPFYGIQAISKDSCTLLAYDDSTSSAQIQCASDPATDFQATMSATQSSTVKAIITVSASDAAGTDDYIKFRNGDHNIEMVEGFEVHTGLGVMESGATTNDGLIANSGEFFYHINAAGDYLIRFNVGGSYFSKYAYER